WSSDVCSSDLAAAAASAPLLAGTAPRAGLRADPAAGYPYTAGGVQPGSSLVPATGAAQALSPAQYARPSVPRIALPHPVAIDRPARPSIRPLPMSASAKLAHTRQQQADQLGTAPSEVLTHVVQRFY